MARLLATLALAGSLVAPFVARADALYSFRDADGVWHFTNVPQDGRFRKVKEMGGGATLHRIAVDGRRTAQARLPSPSRHPTSYDAHIRSAAEKYRLAPQLLKAVMAVES